MTAHSGDQGANAGGTIGAELFIQGEMQSHMQERIGCAELGQILASQCPIRMFQQRVVLGVQRNHITDLYFQRFKGEARAVFTPDFAIELPELVAVRGEHHA